MNDANGNHVFNVGPTSFFQQVMSGMTVEMLLIWSRGSNERDINIFLYRVLLTIIDTRLVKEVETEAGHTCIITYS